MQAWWKWIIGAVILVLGIGQLIRPAHTNPPVALADTMQARLHVNPAVEATFARSCNDCHSNLTVWPWYSHVAPASWLVVYDVRHGREDLNFSEWGIYPLEKQRELLKEICTEVSGKEMPGTAYPFLHPAAKLTAADITSICTWTRTLEQSQAQFLGKE
jgi:hypothetical protein